VPFVFLCAFLWQEPSLVIVVASFPDHGDFLDRHVAQMSLVVAQVEHAGLDFQYLSTQTRSAAAEDVDLSADKS